MDMKIMAAEIVRACREFVEQKIGAVSKQVEDFGKRLDALPVPKDGENGKDADPAEIKALVDAAVAQIPAPKDGTSVTLDDVTPLIEERVKAAVREIPTPANGKDADPALVAELVSAEVAKLPPPADGKSVTVEELTPLVVAEVVKAVAEIPVPKDGRDGRDGENGKDAEPLDKEAIVREVVALIPPPQDGKSVTIEDVEPVLAGMLETAVAALPKPKDGESVPVDQVQRMIDEAVSKAIAAVPVPKDGDHGRDALDIEVLPAINEERRYARGTYASHKGGVWVARRVTEGMEGWQCIWRGLDSIKFEEHEDGRTVTEKHVTSDGVIFTRVRKSREMRYCGVFREGEEYAPGDTVTWGGSLWHCNEQTKDKPIDGSKAWQLAAKRGRDGKDGRDGIDKTAPVKL